ncbi:MAG: YaaL family protein [Heyndrickxia sp.]
MFGRKQKLREEYDQKLINLMSTARRDWIHQKSLVDMSFEYDEELNYYKLTAEAKYFFLFREAKKRNLRIKI